MAFLLSCQDCDKSFGARALFRSVTLGIEEGERVGLIGPNGSGKSTLLRILAGREQPDSGTVSSRRGLRLGYLPQDDDLPPGLTAIEVLLQALEDQPLDGEERAVRIAAMLGRAGFTQGDQPVADLSGGWRRRLALARELVAEPDLLLLDEPTNHLDLEAIRWLEGILRNPPFALLLVSHDRYFLENVATRLVELNRAYPEGHLSVQGTYSDFLIRREELLLAQAHQQVTLEIKARREAEWLRRSAPARSTKPGARIREAERLQEELQEVRARNSQGRAAALDFSATRRKTRELLVAKGLAKSLGGRRLFTGLDLTLRPGTKLGLLGPNGGGKTTLLRLLRGDLEPDGGSVRWADGLRAVYFDQDREQLDRKMRLREALAPTGDTVTYRGRDLHVISWAKRFLFEPEQLLMPLEELSGGEQARVLIARLMLEPADVLLLDEPTNDLDIPTVEVLEESLKTFPGALVLVTHDRSLLDQVTTEVLALDGEEVPRYYADFHQWEEARERRVQAAVSAAKPAPKPAGGLSAVLSRSEQRELKTIEGKIEAAEQEAADLERQVADPAIASDHVKLQECWAALETARRRVSDLYARWEVLEEKRSQARVR